MYLCYCCVLCCLLLNGEGVGVGGAGDDENGAIPFCVMWLNKLCKPINGWCLRCHPNTPDAKRTINTHTNTHTRGHIWTMDLCEGCEHRERTGRGETE